MKAVKMSLLLMAVLGICGRAWCGEPNGPNEPNWPNGGLISHWRFEESNENTAYDWVGGNHGFVSEPNWETGKVGGALGFDGIGGYVDVGDKASLDFGASTDFTIGLWFYTYMTKAGMFVNKRAAGRAPGYDLFINGGKITARISNSLQALAATTGGTYNDISWHHLAAVYDRDDVITIYVDGNDVVSSSSIATIGDIDNSQPFTIGDRNDVDDHAYFEGIIDELMVFDKALSADEVLELYTYGVIGDVNGFGIQGPYKVIENSSTQYHAMASRTDGSIEDVTSSAIWSIEPGVNANIDENGVLTVGDVNTPRNITIYAEYSAGGVTFDAQQTLEVYSLASLEVTGPGEVPENSQAQYTARAHYDNGGTQIVTSFAVWSVEPGTYASISGSGLLTTGDIGTLEDVMVRAEYSAGGATVEAELAVQIYSLVELEITGPGEVIEYTSAQYAATAYYSNGSTADVSGSAVWSVEPNAYASVDDSGLLTAKNIEAAQEVTIYAEYAEGGITVDAELVVQITVYVPQAIYVPADYNTIQAAIDAASDGDTVVVAPGRYVENIDYKGKAITVRSENGPENCIIDCENSRRGFYIYKVRNGEAVIDGFTITNGGGFASAIEGSDCSLTIANCIISRNGASQVEAVYFHGSRLVVINCDISDNLGDGIWCDGGIVSITNCTITGNGRYGVLCSEASSAISSCILSGNSSRQLVLWRGTASVAYSLVQGGMAGVDVDERATLDWGDGNIDTDPLLTPDGHLKTGSPCMEAGDPNGDFTGQVDIDGEERLAGVRVDMGADEFVDSDSDGLPDWWESKYFASPTAAGADDDGDGDGLTNLIEYEVYSSDPTVGSVTYYVDVENGDDSYDGRAPEWDGEHGPKRTIQAGIDTATDTDTVIVAPGRYVENIDYKGKAITVRSSEPSDREVVESTIIDGSEDESGDNGSCVVFDKGEGRTSILEGLTLTRGTGGWADYDDRSLGKSPVHAGGGILCVNSSPTIKRCIIRDNGVEDSAPHGGGIALLGDCKAMISNCVIVHNRGGGYFSSIGCGILVRSKNPGTAISTIRNCTIAHNRPDRWEDWTYQVNCSNTRTRICNTIIWNEACEGHPDCENYWGNGHTRSLLMKDVSPVTHSCVKNAYTYIDDERYADRCDLTLFGGNIDEWPGFAGPYIEAYPNDADYHLLANSVCINAGDPNFVGEAGEMDIDGQARVMGGRIDIGADEVVPEIAVISPTAGDIWTAGSLHVVEWSSYGAGTVDILLSIDGGGSWEMVESGVVDSGIYMWDIPADIDSDEYVISVVPNPADTNVITVDSGVFSVWPYHGPASLPRGRRQGPKVGERYGPEMGCVKWKFETDGPVTASVTLGRRTGKTTKAYVACEDGILYALDADTGRLVWSYDTNSLLFGSAAEERDGTVYVGSEGGKLYAIDKKGQLLWTHTTGGPIYSTPAVTLNGRIYVCSLDGVLYTLARDGSELWSFETNGFAALDGSVFVNPQEGPDGSVYIAGLYEPNLYALNREDGSVKWARNFEFIIDPCDPNSGTSAGWPFAAPAVGADGTIYQTLLYDSHLYAIEGETGDIIWSVELADPCSGLFEADDLARLRYSDGWSSPAVGPDGTIYVSLDDAYLRAVNPGGGIEWVSKLGEMGGFTLTVDDGGLIYAASDDKKVYVVNADGAEVAQFEGEGWLSWPVIGADGTLYVSDANNAVWAISEEACDGETPVLHRAREVKSKKPVEFKKRQIRKSKAGVRVEKWKRK